MRVAIRRLFGLVLAGTLVCAAPAAAAENIAGDILDAVTQPPSARKSSAGTFGRRASGGPTAPTPPTPPSVPATATPALRRSAPARPPASRRIRRPAATPRRPPLVLRYDGVERRAAVCPPKSAGARSKRLPTLIFLHGAGSSAAQAMRRTGLAERATRAGFLVVFPEGLGPPSARGEGQGWNAWTCCGYALRRRSDDVGFISALIRRLERSSRADPRRIFLAGFSNGAMLASRFVLERPGVAAGLAVVAGELPCDAPSPRADLPVLLIHGSLDHVTRFGPTPEHPRTGRFCEDYPARAQADFWVRGMRLSPKPTVRDSASGTLRIEDYFPARTGGRGRLRYVIVKDGGHAWPGGAHERFRSCDLPTNDCDATALVLDFFLRAGRGR